MYRSVYKNSSDEFTERKSRFIGHAFFVTSEEEAQEKISEIKMSTTLDELCRDFPNEFASYIRYCRNLRFKDKPDYDYLRNLLRNLFHRLGFTYDYVFDWNLLKFVSLFNYILSRLY